MCTESPVCVAHVCQTAPHATSERAFLVLQQQDISEMQHEIDLILFDTLGHKLICFLVKS